MKNLNLSIRNIFFSSRCVLCNDKADDKYGCLCYNCYKKIKKKTRFSSWDNFYYLFDYEKDIKKLVSFFKFKNRKYLSVILGEVARDYFNEVLKSHKIDLVIPVPINIKRKRDRGYNQVEEILLYLEIPYSSMTRVKNTRPMHQLLDNKLREENIRGSFEGKLDVDGKIILIVDDIVTTGNTVKEMINTLKSLGEPKRVIVFSLAAARTAIKNRVSFGWE